MHIIQGNLLSQTWRSLPAKLSDHRKGSGGTSGLEDREQRTLHSFTARTGHSEVWGQQQNWNSVTCQHSQVQIKTSFKCMVFDKTFHPFSDMSGTLSISTGGTGVERSSSHSSRAVSGLMSGSKSTDPRFAAGSTTRSTYRDVSAYNEEARPQSVR